MAFIRDDDKDSKKEGVLVTSPYSNYVRPVQPHQPEYIFLDGAGSKKRGRFEMCYIQIGTCYTIGGVIGISQGIHRGMQIVARDKLTRTYNRTQLLNSVLKRGTDVSNKFGTILVYYSIFGIMLEKIRGDEDDICNNIIAGTSSGLLYKSTSGLRNCGIGGLIGFSLTMIYSLISSKATIIKNIKKTVINSKN